MENTNNICHEIRSLYSSLITGELDAANGNRVRKHLQLCEGCASELGDEIALAMVEGKIATPVGVQREIAELTWSTLQSLSTNGISWAKEKLENITMAFSIALQSWTLSQRHRMLRRGHSLGEQSGGSDKTAWPKYKDVAIVGASGQPLGSTVRIEVVEPPTVKDGRLHIILRTDDPRLEGGTMICTVQAVQRMKVTFDGQLNILSENKVCWQAAIEADGLPPYNEIVVIPEGQVVLSVKIAGRDYDC